MSLFVVYKSKNKNTGKPFQFEVHAPFKRLREFVEFVEDEIDFIQADGDELDVIQDTFAGESEGYSIPMPIGKKVVRWYGDIAKTIYYNL